MTRERNKRSVTGILQEMCKYLAPDVHGRPVSVSTGRRWFNDGTRLGRLAGAGSLYIVILLSCARAKQDIRTIPDDEWGRLTRLIRMPTSMLPLFSILSFSKLKNLSDTPQGRVICNVIIPAIAHLRQKYPIMFSTLFPLEMVRMGCAVDIEGWNLDQSDQFFDGLKIK